MEDYLIPSDLIKLLTSKTFTCLMLNNQHKTPIWRLHFSNCRFTGMSLGQVVNTTIKYYSDMTNTVSRN